MKQAVKYAKLALERGEVPIASVIVDPRNDKIIAHSYNLVEKQNDPTAHAEILAIRKACRLLGTKQLTGYDIYVTLEPCAMCAKAISLAKLRRLYFGAYDAKEGGVEHGPHIFNNKSCNHKPEIYGGIMEDECKGLLKGFFDGKR